MRSISSSQRSDFCRRNSSALVVLYHVFYFIILIYIYIYLSKGTCQRELLFTLLGDQSLSHPPTLRRQRLSDMIINDGADTIHPRHVVGIVHNLDGKSSRKP